MEQRLGKVGYYCGLWFGISSVMVGAPMVVLGMVVGAKALYYTLACHSADRYCERAIGGGSPSRVAVDYVVPGDLVEQLRIDD